MKKQNDSLFLGRRIVLLFHYYLKESKYERLLNGCLLCSHSRQPNLREQCSVSILSLAGVTTYLQSLQYPFKVLA